MVGLPAGDEVFVSIFFHDGATFVAGFAKSWIEAVSQKERMPSECKHWASFKIDAELGPNLEVWFTQTVGLSLNRARKSVRNVGEVIGKAMHER